MQTLNYFDLLRRNNPTIENLCTYISEACPNYLSIYNTASPATNTTSTTPVTITSMSGSLTAKAKDIVFYSCYVSLSTNTGTVREPTIDLYIYRDSTPIQSFTVRNPHTVGSSAGQDFGAGWSGYDIPGAGTFTYSLKWALTGATGGTTVYTWRQILNAFTLNAMSEAL